MVVEMVRIYRKIAVRAYESSEKNRSQAAVASRQRMYAREVLVSSLTDSLAQAWSQLAYISPVRLYKPIWGCVKTISPIEIAS